jgi:hypothetical protein
VLPNDPNQVNAIFTQMVTPIADVEENMFAINMHRGIKRLGYKAELVRHEESFSHILIPAADDYYIEISAIEDEDGITLPLMVYEEYDENILPLMEKAMGVNGRYRYQATFTIHFDDSDTQRILDRELSEDDICGIAYVGEVEYTAYSFQEFIQGALYKIQRAYDIEIYPTIRVSHRKAF